MQRPQVADGLPDVNRSRCVSLDGQSPGAANSRAPRSPGGPRPAKVSRPLRQLSWAERTNTVCPAGAPDAGAAAVPAATTHHRKRQGPDHEQARASDPNPAHGLPAPKHHADPAEPNPRSAPQAKHSEARVRERHTLQRRRETRCGANPGRRGTGFAAGDRSRPHGTVGVWERKAGAGSAARELPGVEGTLSSSGGGGDACLRSVRWACAPVVCRRRCCAKRGRRVRKRWGCMLMDVDGSRLIRLAGDEPFPGSCRGARRAGPGASAGEPRPDRGDHVLQGPWGERVGALHT